MLVERYKADSRERAMVPFPGGYIAEIHAVFRPSGVLRSLSGTPVHPHSISPA